MHRISILLFFWSVAACWWQPAQAITKNQPKEEILWMVESPIVERDTLIEIGTPESPEDDPQVVYKDSARLAIEALTRKAWRRSMILPGWGQVTNGGLWWIKVPAIYGGFVATGLVFEFNNRYYKSILANVQYREANNHAIPPNSPYDYIAADSQGTQYLIGAKDYYRRNRDLMVLVTLGWYALNIVEAYVDSMLKNRWDIGDNYSMQVTPFAAPPTPFAPTTPVFGFNVKLNIATGK